MDTTSVILIVAIILVVALIGYVVWRNPKVKTSVGLGPIKINLDTERADESSAGQRRDENISHNAQPAASLSVGNIHRSQVINEGAGGRAEMQANDVTHSTIINTSGKARHPHSTKQTNEHKSDMR
ncbi:MAG: hypothetical protein KatS3mg052_2603 [Candidatus Roseilinea sp.]|nr:MAG: hypothetical protein KatS3mg052_2603 [Candidatus Roseilinea sp.]